MSKYAALNASSDQTIVLGTSACLMGDKVRFDAGHKQDRFLLDDLSQHVTYKKVCPEVAAGFGIPRAAMQLRKVDGSIELVVSQQPDKLVTTQLVDAATSLLDDLATVDGFVFKKGSPSCGLFRVPVVINDDGYKEYAHRGLFAQAFTERFPLIPTEEEGRLQDAALRENFLERVYAYKRWQRLVASDADVQTFIEFHSCHKFQLMARGSSYYQELGRMVAGTTKQDLKARRDAYISRFMQVMALRSERGRQVNVLQHIMGYLKQAISSEDKKELLSVFEAYRVSQMPLITALTLLRHHLRKYPQQFIDKQHYLMPYPDALALRSSVY